MRNGWTSIRPRCSASGACVRSRTTWHAGMYPLAAWLAEAGEPLLLAIEEQNEVAMRLGADGQVRFFALKSGEELSSVSLALPADTRITSIGQDTPGSRLLALGLDNGQVLVLEHNYKVSYPDNRRTISPQIEIGRAHV